MVTEQELRIHMERGNRMKWRYVDYEKGTYTIPVLITEKRIEQVINDNSVDEIIIIEECD